MNETDPEIMELILKQFNIYNLSFDRAEDRINVALAIGFIALVLGIIGLFV